MSSNEYTINGDRFIFGQDNNYTSSNSTSSNFTKDIFNSDKNHILMNKLQSLSGDDHALAMELNNIKNIRYINLTLNNIIYRNIKN